MLKIPYPYHLCSAEQCRRMDERTINEFGIDGFTLMEIAGTKAADFILTEIDSKSHGLFICGKGNNAGDALVVARILSEKDHPVTICFVGGADALSEDTSKNLELLKQLKGNITYVEWGSGFDFSKYDFVVDGMFGTGLNSGVRAPFDEVINEINRSDKTVFSLDLPSGLHADTGSKMGNAVLADFTITFGALKTGFYLNDGFEHSGEIVLCELPFPNHFKEKSAFLIHEDWFSESNTQQKKREHKYDGGVLYIIAGSEGLTGAAILAAQSAWSTGVGAVVLITPKGLLNIYEKNLTQIIKKSVGTDKDTYFATSHFEQVQSILNEKSGSLLIGPGLGRDPETLNFLQELLSDFNGNVVIDADALFALSESDGWKKPDEANWILTPHPGELKKLLHSEVRDGFDRLIQVSKVAKENGVTVLSKGFPCVLGTTSGNTYLTGYDTRIFSRAGFGDILAGKISGYLLALKEPDSACIKALIEGKQKADAHFRNSKSELEPIHLI
ncbi:MAG: NAD(P)H-hydrate dehydratase [Balneola sp.]|nr:NAD(P)H-hydrate dehydratase [Balneola sp.]MBO6651976.1 NAD(P)H-hydrate dehydratase [Balneola sp.]MBO6712710.1 NAD(P)H-hydrate dehydratase [Balneola sp.]MBO6801372.1 NAD(P)H-hydrate dehydratase [Balneola sp.]MBO6870469.1 NAD(P)H-hydrate dehydratase [Balneola sp.]